MVNSTLRKTHKVPRRIWAVSLFGAWIILASKTAAGSYTAEYENAALLGIVFIVATAAIALLPASIMRAIDSRPAAFCLSLVLFASNLFLTSEPSGSAIVGIACLQALCGAWLLRYFIRLLCTLDPLSRFIACIGSMIVGSAAYVAVLLTALILDTIGNSRFLTVALTNLFSILPCAAMCLVGRADRPAPEKTGCVPQSASMPASKAGMAVFCLCSLLTGFITGFTTLPHLFGWTFIAGIETAIMLTVSLVFSAIALYRKNRQLSLAKEFFIFVLALMMAGFTMLAMNVSRTAFLAHSVLGAAHACFFALTLILIAQSVDARKNASGMIIALGVLFSGTYWAYEFGIATRQFFGFDLNIISPLASLFVAVLAGGCALFVFLTDARLSTAQGPVEETADQEPVQHALESIEVRREHALDEHHLTPKEKMVALEVLKGFTASTISTNIGISESTVRFHLTNIYRKLDVQSRNEVIQLLEHELVESKDGSPKGTEMPL